MKNLNVLERAMAPTPKFFKIARTVGLVLATVGGSIIAAPIALPVVIVNLAGYLMVAGGVLTGISQVTVDEARVKTQEDES